MRSRGGQSNIVPACALVFLFYLLFVPALGGRLPEMTALSVVLLLVSFIVEYALYYAMLMHVYDTRFVFLRNGLALFACACCAYFVLRGDGAGVSVAYTAFAAAPMAAATLRRKRKGAAGRAAKTVGPAKAADGEGKPPAAAMSAAAQLERDRAAAYRRYAMPVAEPSPGKRLK